MKFRVPSGYSPSAASSTLFSVAMTLHKHDTTGNDSTARRGDFLHQPGVDPTLMHPARGRFRGQAKQALPSFLLRQPRTVALLVFVISAMSTALYLAIHRTDPVVTGTSGGSTAGGSFARTAPPPAPASQSAVPGAPVLPHEFAQPPLPAPETDAAPAGQATAPRLSVQEMRWKEAARANTAAAYQSYLHDYPGGLFSTLATTRLARLKTENDIAALPRPAAAPPSAAESAPKVQNAPAPGPAAGPAAAGTVPTDDAQAWDVAAGSDSRVAYQAYLENFPLGAHAAAARERLEGLANAAAAPTHVRPPPLPAAVPAPAKASGDRPPVAQPMSRLAGNDAPPEKPPYPVPAAPAVRPEAGAPAPAGKNVIRFDNQILTGTFTNDPVSGLLSGQGHIAWKNGDRFDGTLVKGVRGGAGTFLWANGQRYTGEWSRDLPNGRGTLYFANGNRYTGDVMNGVPNGTGTIEFADGNRYTGEVGDGVPNGKGINRFRNGDVYDGAWQRGKSHGQGRYTWANGNYWEGNFRNDQRTENGKMVNAKTPAPVTGVSMDNHSGDAAAGAGRESAAE